MRPDWDEFFLNIARAVSMRASCSKASVGAVVVRDKHILCAGYNGAPYGTRHCEHILRRDGVYMTMQDQIDGHCSRAVHAESNAIAQGARVGTSLAGGTLYCTRRPCRNCSMLIIQAGIVRVVFIDSHNKGEAEPILVEANIDVTRIASGN